MHPIVRFRWIAAFLTLALLATWRQVVCAAPPQASGYDRADLNPQVRPQDDFYEYAVGGYLKSHPIPPDRSSFGVDVEINERVQGVLRDILEGLTRANATAGSDDQKLGDFYASAMDTAVIESAGLAPLHDEFSRIETIHSIGDVMDEVARLHRMRLDALFGFGPDQDFKNPDMVIGEFVQSGLSLPDRDYYVLDDVDKQRVRTAFLNHMKKMFALMGDPEALARSHAGAVLAIETRLARSSMTADEMRDPKALYHPTSIGDLQRRTPDLSWDRYFDTIGVRRLRSVNVATPKFFDDLEDTLHAVSLDDWKTYLRWQLVNGTAPYLSSRFDVEDFDFRGRVMTGAQRPLARWKRAVSWTDNYIGEALGRKFVQRCFSSAAKAKALEMVETIKTVVRDRINHGWMSEGSRHEALKKIDCLVAKIGYPDKWKDYSKLCIDRSPFVTNVLRAQTFLAEDEFSRIGHAVDRTRWDMTPSTVNAYYDPQKNEIVFPAAILQPPYFDVQADDAANYGETGAVIGHELTHAFDDEGSQFDAHGNLRNWWSASDQKHFETLADGVAGQFSEFSFDGQKVDGKRVEGESIADLGGLEIAYAAFKVAEARHSSADKSPDGFSPDQRFFLNYAFSWATNMRAEKAHLLISSNPHPLPKFRVNGPLANMPAFFAAFDVRPGDPMRRMENKRNRLWDP